MGDGDGSDGANDGRGDDHLMMPTPVMVAVIGLLRREGHPAHMLSAVNPRDAAGRPREQQVEERNPDVHADHRRSPVPGIPDQDPVAVMVGHVPERFCRDPGLVSGPFGPAADRERGPSCRDRGRPPEDAFFAVIGNPFPCPVLLKHGSLVLETRGQILGGRPARGGLLRPEGFPVGVPLVPAGLDGSRARRDLTLVGEDGWRSRRRVVLGVCCAMDKTHRPGDPNHLDGILAHVIIEGGARRRHDVPEWTAGFDHCLRAGIVESGDAGRDVGFGDIRGEGHHLHLGAVAKPDRGAVGCGQFRHPLIYRKQRIACTEGGIIGHGDPVFGRRHIPEQIPLDVVDATDDGRIICNGRGRNCSHCACDQKQKAQTLQTSLHRALPGWGWVVCAESSACRSVEGLDLSGLPRGSVLDSLNGG
jgi:hypothetical protein